MYSAAFKTKLFLNLKEDEGAQTKERDVLAGLLPSCPQQSELGEAKARN